MHGAARPLASSIVLASPNADLSNLTYIYAQSAPRRFTSARGGRVRKRTAPLARERRNLRSESNVFYHLLFGRIAPLASQSARHARILDRGGRSGPPALISAGPRVGLRIWQKTPKFITENLSFAYGLPYGWSCRRLPGATAR